MYKLLLCVRYLRTRYIALASIVSVMLGVATMIVVNSVMAGFTSEMRDRIHGFLADVVIESRHTEGIQDSDRWLQLVEDTVGDYLVAKTPTVEIPGMLRVEFRGQAYPMPVAIVGIIPSSKAQVGSLRDYLGNYQSSVVDGTALAPARSADEPIQWDLTNNAMEYRRQMKLAIRDYLERKQLLQIDTTPAAEPVFEEDRIALQEPDFTEAEDDEAIAAVDGPDTGEPGSPSVLDQMLAGDNPFHDETDTGPEDDTAPLRARVFIGEDLISFMAEDPETGEKTRISMARPGDDVTLTTVRIDPGTGKPETVSFKATICDRFRSGMSEYDGKLVLMNMEELQRVRGMLHMDNSTGEVISGAVTSIQLKLRNFDDAPEVIRRLREVIPASVAEIQTWESKQGLLLEAVDMETAILNVLLFLIITVAGFGILAIFYMIVVEKTRDIGILKSLGASSRGIMTIFLSYGLGLGLVGAIAGVSIGLVFVRYINQIETALSWMTGRRVFDRDIYNFSSIPTHVSPMMVFWVAIGAMAIAVLASVLPARRASRLHPVRALRFD